MAEAEGAKQKLVSEAFEDGVTLGERLARFCLNRSSPNGVEASGWRALVPHWEQLCLWVTARAWSTVPLW